MPLTVLLLTFAALSADLVLASLYPENRAMKEYQKEVCDTPECLQIANTILKSIDASLDPCEDFYSYACGTPDSYHTGPDFIEPNLMLKLADLLDSQPIIKKPKSDTEKVVLDYQVCKETLLTETQEFDSIRKILEEEGFGAWPLTNKTGEQVKFNSLEEVFLAIGIDHIGNVLVGPNILGDRSAIIWIDVDVQPFIEVNQGMEENQTLNDAAPIYRHTKDKFGPIATKEQVEDILKACSRMWHGLQQKLKHTRHIEPAVKMTYKELEDRIPLFPILKLINSLLKDVDVTLTYDDVLLLGNPDEFKDTIEFLNGQSFHELYNCFGLIRARGLVKLTSEAMHRQAKEIKELGRLSATEEQLLSVLCLQEVRKTAPAAFTRLYVQNSPNIRERKARGRRVLNKIANAYHTHLQFLPWFDRKTRPRALQKLWNMRPLVGFTENLMEAKPSESTHENPAVIRRNDSFAMINTLLMRTNKKTMYEYLRKGGRVAPHVYPYEDYNAFYHPVQNEIAILDGLLHSPFMNSCLPLYFQLASVGSVIGHELTHAFDGKGQVFDENGNVGVWWSDYSQDSFKEKSGCLVEQYGKIVDPIANMSVNGRYYLRHNIADNAGIRMALRAFRAHSLNSKEVVPKGLEKYSSEQLFFIAHAMSMCLPHTAYEKLYSIKYGFPLPNRYRVNVPLQNTEEFSAAFLCKKGSPMRISDADRCAVF